MAGLSLKRSRQAPAEETSAFGGVAERFRRAGDLDRAIALCREGLQRFPDLLSARVTLGWALLDKGAFAEARTELQQVLKRAPDNLAAIRGLAELHDRMDGAEGAVESWHQPSESEAAEAPNVSKAPVRAAKASRGKSKRAVAVPEPPVAAPEPEPEIEQEPEAEFDEESEPEVVASPSAETAEAAEVEAPAILSAAAAAIEAAEATRADHTTPAAEVAFESPVSEPVARADMSSDEVSSPGVSEAFVDHPVVSAADGWEEPAPVAGEPGVLSQAIDHAHGQEAWEDAGPAIAKDVVAEPPTIDLDAAALADAVLASDAAALAAQTEVVSEDARETPSMIVDAGVVLGDASDNDEAADLERLLATVELADSSSNGEVVVPDVGQTMPLVTSADVVPFAELVTAADLAMAGAAEPVSFTSLDSPVTLPDAPAAVVSLVTAEPVASSPETADEAQALAALPPLDLIPREPSPAPAPVVPSPPARVESSVEAIAEQVVAPVIEQAVEPAAPDVVSYQPSAAYEPATWQQPAAWHAPASPQPTPAWPDELMAPAKHDELTRLSLGTSFSSRHAQAPRVSRKRAQVAALEKFLRRVEARRLRLETQSVA